VSTVPSKATSPRFCGGAAKPLAIDLHLVPYHGELLCDAQEIYRSQAKSGTCSFHAYATAYVLRKACVHRGPHLVSAGKSQGNCVTLRLVEDSLA